MHTKQHFLWLLLCSLCFVACRQDLEDEALIEAPRVDHSELRSMQALFESRYKTESLRSLEAKGELDFSELEVNWEHPVRDTLEGHIETTALTINLKDFRLPTSQTFERSDVERFRGLVSVPRLYHYKDLRSGKEYFAVVVTQPTKDWLEGHGIEEVYQSVRVPASFEGQLDVYSVDKKPLLRYVYREGRGVALHRAMSARSREQARVSKMICIYGITGYTHRQEVISSDNPFSGTITGGYTIADVVVVDIKVPEYGYTCVHYPSPVWDRNVLEQILKIGITDDDFSKMGDHLPEAGGVSLYDSPSYQEYLREERKKKIKEAAKNDCDSLKLLIQGLGDGELYEKIKEVHEYFKKTKPHKIIETGYLHYQDGTFLALKAENDGHFLAIPIQTPNLVKGYLHNHMKRKVNRDGFDEVSVQIFSSRDIETFLTYASRHKNATSTYAMLVTGKYLYRLGLSGDNWQAARKAMSLLNQRVIDTIRVKHDSLLIRSTDLAFDSYDDVEPLYQSFVDMLVRYLPLDGLIIQRVNLESEQLEIKTTALYGVDDPTPRIEGDRWVTSKQVDTLKIDC